MTKHERDELAKLVRRREKLAKGDVDRLAAERKAEFEARLAMQYDAYDERWREGMRRMEAQMAEVNKRIVEELVAEGQPREFCPQVHVAWSSRGDNAIPSRRAELRKVADTHIAALARTAKVEIERRSLEVQTELVAGGLQSEQAKAFLAEMPTAEQLMPGLSLADVEAALSVERNRGAQAFRDDHALLRRG